MGCVVELPGTAWSSTRSGDTSTETCAAAGETPKLAAMANTATVSGRTGAVQMIMVNST